MRGHPKIRSRRRYKFFLIGVLVLFAAATAGCSDSDVSRVHIKLKDDPASETKSLPPKVDSPPPVCPPAGMAQLQPSASGTGHHNVTLTWNASPASRNPDDEAFGYCLYRSKEKKVAKQNATCAQCEQVNSTPIIATGCVDNLVQDGTTYYYVAVAISRRRQLSPSSNEITVVVPPATQKSDHAPASSYPLCRVPANSK